MKNQKAIYQVPEERRYWVVRADGGQYYDHFLQEGVIALRHINWMNLPDTKEGGTFFPEVERLTESFDKRKDREDINPQRSSTQLGQTKAFLFEINIGDWVMTVGQSTVRFGRIISQPFVNKKAVKVIYNLEENTGTFMDFHLRRRV